MAGSLPRRQKSDSLSIKAAQGAAADGNAYPKRYGLERSDIAPSRPRPVSLILNV
jgi:hypothetical protein